MNINDLPQSAAFHAGTDYFWPEFILTILALLFVVLAFILLMFKANGIEKWLICIGIALVLTVPAAILAEKAADEIGQARDDTVATWLNSTYELSNPVAMLVEGKGGDKSWDSPISMNIKDGNNIYTLTTDVNGELFLMNSGGVEAPLRTRQ